MVGAGKRDRLVTIERKTITRSDTGAVIETWATWKTRWMEKEDVSGVERLRADQELAVETTTWRDLYIDDLRAEDRLNYDGKIYDIMGIKEVGRRAGTEILSMAVRV